jgi:hypothetical protein
MKVTAHGDHARQVAARPLTSSFFPGDSRQISDEALKVILDSELALPAHARLTLVPLSGRYEPRWSREAIEAHDTRSEKVLKAYRALPGIAEAMWMPSLVMPQQADVPHLRVAAARMMSPLILAYQTEFDSYSKQPFLSDKKVRFYCRVEAVLLDVRTGVVAYSAVSRQMVEARKREDDYSPTEATLRARSEAETQALLEVAGKKEAFLRNLGGG